MVGATAVPDTELAGLTGESACPTLMRKGLSSCGAGAFACQPRRLAADGVSGCGTRLVEVDTRPSGGPSEIISRAFRHRKTTLVCVLEQIGRASCRERV